MSDLDRLAACVQGLATISALASAIDLFLPDGEGKRSLDFLLRLAVTLTLATALAGFVNLFQP